MAVKDLEDQTHRHAPHGLASSGRRRPALMRALLIAGYAALVVGCVLAGPWLANLVQFDWPAMDEPQLHRMLLLVTVTYVLTLALPFVPGAEIGLALLMVMGPAIVPLVYGSTVAALSISFLVGRLIPARVTATGLSAFGLHRARDLMLRLEALDPAERMKFLSSSAPQRMLPFLLRHRYLMFALALNLPGNSLIGGGGGIALAAGLSRLVSPAGFLATVAIAVAPVPLLFLLTGKLL
jgi:hypothetical protein